MMPTTHRRVTFAAGTCGDRPRSRGIRDRAGDGFELLAAGAAGVEAMADGSCPERDDGATADACAAQGTSHVAVAVA